MRFTIVVLLVAAFARVGAERAAASTPSPSPLTQLTFKERMIAGAGARGIAQTVLHPIDVVRTCVQAKGVTMNLKPQTFVKGLAPQVGAARCGVGSPSNQEFSSSARSHTRCMPEQRVHLPFLCPHSIRIVPPRLPSRSDPVRRIRVEQGQVGCGENCRCTRRGALCMNAPARHRFAHTALRTHTHARAHVCTRARSF